jgi:uncharacterized membrane protein
MTQHLAQDSASSVGGSAETIPDAVVAVFATEADLTAAIKHLEHEKYDMAAISVLGTGISQERHVVGFETQRTHAARWATWGGLWGWVFGAFVFVPGIGHVAIGGYLLFMLITAGIGATGGALGGALTSMGIPKDGIPVYETDLRSERFLVIAHGTPGEVDRARTLLAQTTHERLDHHQAPAVAGTPAGSQP